MHKLDKLEVIHRLLVSKGYTADLIAHADGRYEIGTRMTQNADEALKLVAMLEDRIPKLQVIH